MKSQRLAGLPPPATPPSSMNAALMSITLISQPKKILPAMPTTGKTWHGNRNKKQLLPLPETGTQIVVEPLHQENHPSGSWTQAPETTFQEPPSKMWHYKKEVSTQQVIRLTLLALARQPSLEPSCQSHSILY